MSRHEGVSCDSCMKGNFRGKRYKCLICYDYDLCATCYEAGATTTRHTVDHPMQCILTRTDFDLYYGGEALTAEQPQAFTCPYCGKMGYTEATLQEHVTTDHADSAIEVVCPVCAALPGGEPNHVTDDFAAHLTLEHRAPREFQDEPISGIRHVRRIPHPGRGMGGTRARRTNMHFQSAGSTLSGLSPSSRETTMDPIAELLSQLSSVRSRAAAAQSVSSQLQQLEMQLQSTRQEGRLEVTMVPIGINRQSVARQQLERLPRRQADSGTKATTGSAQQASSVIDFSSSSGSGTVGSNVNSQFLLARCGDGELSELERQTSETERADRSMFVQELLLSTLAEGLRLDDSPLDPSPFAPFNPQLDESDSQPHSPDPAVMTTPDSSGRAVSAGHCPSIGAGAGSGSGAGGVSNAGAGAAGSGGSVTCAGAATNTLLPRADKRERPASTHRNMVKRLAESNKKLEKEPPPVMKAKLSQH